MVDIGLCVDKKVTSANYIIFLDSVFYYHFEEVRLYIIAHEIGHAYLNHPRDMPWYKYIEDEADSFAAEHGFAKPKDQSKIRIWIRWFKKQATIIDKVCVILIVLIFIWLVFMVYFLELLGID